MEEQNKLAPFGKTETFGENRPIRKVWHNEQWYFAVTDIIQALTDTNNPRQYWTKVKNKIAEENELQPIWLQLKMRAPDGKNRLTDAANTEGVLRIAMSVPSPKAEPLKLWLAQVGRERIEEIENPELMTERLAELYRAKGYPEEWVVQRLQTIETRKELTDEWKKRGIKETTEYGILTAEIAKATFGLTPSEHKELKGLNKTTNLRDNMTRIELIFTALGEESTRIVTNNMDAQGFQENHEAAFKGGTIAGNARRNLERVSNEKVVSATNFLDIVEGDQAPSPLPHSDDTTEL